MIPVISKDAPHVTMHGPLASSLAHPLQAPQLQLASGREIYRHPLLPADLQASKLVDCALDDSSIRSNRQLLDGQTPAQPAPDVNMFRTAILRSAAAASRAAMRPIPSAAARRFAVAPAPRVSSFVPKTVSWQAVRCYASGSSLDKTEVYERIKQLLSGFDKVGLTLPFHLSPRQFWFFWSRRSGRGLCQVSSKDAAPASNPIQMLDYVLQR